jgi:signal transduction histidine kinase/integral membrane sensor domain MASE1
MESVKTNPLARKVLAVTAVAAVYYGLARVGLELALAGTASCPIWPASGFALAGAIALGPEACLGVFLGSWLANLHALPGLHAASPLLAALACAAVALGGALQALAGARLLRGELGGPDPLSRSRDVVRFAGLTPLICLLSASVGVGALVASGLLARNLFARAWVTWWIGDLVGVLIMAPLLFAWRPRETDKFGEPPSLRRALAGASALALLSLSVWLGFGDLFPPDTRYPLSFLPFTALIWITLRLDFRGATAGAAALAALVQWHTIRGLGPFAVGRTLDESLLLASAYIAAAALTAFLLRALLAELKEARAALERRMSEQGEDLSAANAHLRAAALGRDEDGRRIQLYSRIVGELPVGIAVLCIDDPRDPESWLIVELNPAGLRLAAAGGENLAGRRLLEFAPEVRGSDLLHACAETLRLNHDVDIPDFVSRKRVPGGHFSIKVFPLGAPLVGLAFEDVTARKTTEAALARSNAELAQFAFVASHDLQAPLRKTAAFAEELKLRLGGGLDEISRDFMERMGRSIEVMQTLIDALLKLAQVSTSVVAPREVNLATLAADVLGDLEKQISRSGARVKCSSLPVVLGDPQQMRQLLQNLIENALKFTTPGQAPQVRLLGWAFDDGHCELIVEDDGVGFDMKFADRIFQPFQRLHSRKDYPGNGMGLAICQKIVDRLGGKISVESSIGRGTRFTVVFPVGRANEMGNAPLMGTRH